MDFRESDYTSSSNAPDEDFSASLKTVQKELAEMKTIAYRFKPIPMENSIRGTVRETLDNLILAKNPNIKILAEYYQPINYCLLSRTTEIYSISGIIAPPEMLAKCREFVKNDIVGIVTGLLK